ncbi:MAG: DUF481 domain-containing protein [Calditrichae bacterium]|nr:DUF481 domain-containing protein [Calditrichia bacterium]
MIKNTFFKIVLTLLLIPVASFSQINTEKYRSIEDSTGLILHSEFDLKFEKGNVDFQELSIETTAQYKFRQSDLMTIISGDLGWEGGQRFSNAMLMHLRYTQNITKTVQLEFFTQVDYDKSRLLTGRFISGAGTRLRLWHGEEQGLWLGNSLFYENEKYDLPANTTHLKNVTDGRFSTYLSFIKDFKDYIEFNGVIYYQPRLSDWIDYKIVSEAGLNMELTKHVAISVSLVYRFDNKPPDTIKKQDIALENGLVINF